jgi:adenylate cyclase
VERDERHCRRPARGQRGRGVLGDGDALSSAPTPDEAAEQAEPKQPTGSGESAARSRTWVRRLRELDRTSRELGAGALQVWQTVADIVGRDPDRQVTLLFTDIVGFSEWALHAGDDEAVRLTREVTRVVETAVITHDGRVVKRLGDGTMAVFAQPQDGFDAVVEAMAALREVSVAGHRPHIRAALHTGTPRSLGTDYIGVDVNVAARLADRARGDEILVSDSVRAKLDPSRVATRRKKSLLLSRIKGVPSDVAVYVATPR